MKKITFVFVCALALSAFGCKKKAASGGDCAAAINKSMDLAKADMQKMPGMTDSLMQKMRDVSVTRCKDDKWSADAIKCMTDAATEADSQKCYGKLTPDQQKAMNQAAMDAMMAASGGGGMGGSAGGAAGSADMGSAAAGSAAAGSAEMGSAAAGSAAAGSAK
jgi:hypothetical protein